MIPESVSRKYEPPQEPLLAQSVCPNLLLFHLFIDLKGYT